MDALITALPFELMSANKPEGISMETMVHFDALMSSINSLLIPSGGLFNPVPNNASMIISLSLMEGKKSADCFENLLYPYYRTQECKW